MELGPAWPRRLQALTREAIKPPSGRSMDFMEASMRRIKIKRHELARSGAHLSVH